ncbi:branched-chain amino acid ABC transporter permease [Variovorax paradoxus]|uniref:Branched-chain amino acid ABC transporter permease n=1 Tax=Variovorax paradoxus TaxID=34073 RepID=A0A5Q0M420_VARPD|nr:MULTISPECIES: branched-chain amino acid ABC transporter permease [Variovorax]PBI95740.1 High-affinity branched-chain amino acid transport system permease protein LivH [Variovorax boronicumulans]QFZ83968.1 branched-chain amino acid ABC transporter permease [Variovorax paradoxus]
MNTLLNILIDGLAYGMVLFVIAVGLSVTLGLMRFVNLSHGAFAMVGGYCAALLTREAQWSFWLAVPAAVLATALLGGLLEALVLRHLYRRKELEQVLFTIGLSFVLIATTNALVGPQVQMIPLPPLLSGSVDLGFRTLPAQRLLVIGAGCAVAALAAWTVSCTRFGIWLRAAVDHSGTASSLGIPIRTVQCASFAAGAALAGLGGILGAELMPLEPYYALKYLVLVLVVVSVGGMGSITGSLLAAVLLGVIETASKYLASEWGSLFFFVAMALLLAWRPNGLLKR